MANLQPAHRGYEHQDLLCACRLVDLVLGTLAVVHVDEKQFDDDRFDDLTVVTVDGLRERTQFKNTDDDDRPLTVTTFTSEERGLRLDRLVAAAVADRDGPGRNAADISLRVVLRDSGPVDEALTAVLVPANPDPGPFVGGMQTQRLRFDVDRLWPVTQPMTATSKRAAKSRFAFLCSGKNAVDRADLEWLCARLIIEVEAPKSSGIMLEPGPAEQILLTRVRTEVGAESYPNAGRSAADVAEAFATYARQARQGLTKPNAEGMLHRAQLRRDFGAVSRAHPVDRSWEVDRPTTIADIFAAADDAAVKGIPLLLTGPPGQGKSWACDQLIRALTSAGWLTAEHYCYLADAQAERDERVQAETVFGSLLARLAEAEPTLVDTQRPRYAADDVALANAVTSALAANPDRRVALVVDGLDHVARVLPSKPGTDPSAALAAALAALDLPVGSVLIVLSQPGEHIAPLQYSGAKTLEIPSLTGPELAALADKLGLIDRSDATASIIDEQHHETFLALLEERSRGNGLYATYLCREVMRRPHSEADPEAVLSALPPFDGSLENYYNHLMVALGPASAVADVVGLIDFPVTRAELAEMRPDLAHRLDDALARLAPVLTERAVQGGLRVYHESFARFLRRQIETNPGAYNANLRFAIDWLTNRGFYRDSRAFRFLLPMLAAAGRDREVLALVDVTFAANAVAGGHPASAIAANLAIATGCAGRAKDLAALTRCVELARAAECFENESLDSAIVEYVDVPIALLGGEEFASRLMFEGRIAVPARAGIQLCAALDAAGVAAPWQDYLPAFAKRQANDTTSYGSESGRAVTLAWVRGQLRQALPEIPDQTRDVRIANFLNDTNLSPDEVIPTVADVIGIRPTAELIDHLDKPPDAALVLAEIAHDSSDPNHDELIARLLIRAAQERAPGNAHRLLAIGATAEQIDSASITDLRAALIALTQEVTSKDALHPEGRVPTWLDLCAVTARRDPTILPTVEGMLTGEGWYRCWLQFTLALAQAEAAETDQANLALEALRHLTGDLRPFVGSPRACDLYPIHGLIECTLRRALALLDDPTWPLALAVLKDVIEGVGVSLRGQDAGPITPDLLLALAISGTTTPGRRPSTQALINKVLAEGGGRRYYSTLAEYRLMAARFALANGDNSQAGDYWTEACQLMTAYGWHKDITIYEVLDPLPNLITADPARARTRLARVQASCERVVLHTDRKSVRSAWIQWWTFLAKADPAALTNLAVPALLKGCGHVNDLYLGALEDLWRSWYHLADPIVAGALRLALPMAIDDHDAAMAERLVDIADGSGMDLAGRLLTHILSRADERPVRHSYSNSDELVAADNARVETINAVTARINAPMIGVTPVAASEEKPQPATSAARRIPEADKDQIPVLALAPGAAGVARAIRTWRRRPYESTSPEWTPDRFANIIGYRLVELADTGDEEGAATALHSLAGALEAFDRSGLLKSLGEGLERHSQPRLAAIAFTLTWTRARGNGGWMNFGGQTELDSLRRAAGLDEDSTLATVVSEITRVVGGSHRGSYGVSQALIHATLAGSLKTPAQPADAAFAAWDEALAVIALRTPRMADEDDPSEQYVPPQQNAGANPTRDINIVFSEAIIGAIAHPGRENRRRALLAFEILLENRLEAAAGALSTTLSALDEPASLSWLLRVIESRDAAALETARHCVETLQRHASGSHLTVRALASRLLGDQAPQPPMTPPDSALLANSTLWRPDESESADPVADFMVTKAAGGRLDAAEELLPRLGQAVVARVGAAIAESGRLKAIDDEARKLADTRHERWADAFTGRDALVEDALQRAAAGGRAALLAGGALPTDGGAWEYALASRLINNPWLPLAVERTRQPRPNFEPPPSAGDPRWKKAQEAAAAIGRNGSSTEVDLRLTVKSAALSSCDTVLSGRFRSWRVVAVAEEHIVLPVWPEPDNLLRRSGRDYGLELRQPSDTAGLHSRPFAIDTTANWFAALPPMLGQVHPVTSLPLIGLDLDGDALADTPEGLGIHSPLLAPTVLLRHVLGLQPDAEPFILHHAAGPGMAMISWRSHYETSEYHLPWQRISGTAIVVSPATFDKLLAWGGDRLSIREVIHGDKRLAGGA